MNAEKPRLDELLANLPLPTSPQATVKEPRERDSARFAKHLERTLARIQAERTASYTQARTDCLRPDLEMDDVLRTPLPLEPGEPDPNQFRVDARRTPPLESFEGIFAGETLDSDPLRAPLKSGEHAHFRPAVAPSPSVDALDNSTPHKSRPRLALVLGGVTTFLAAAAAVALFIRIERKETPQAEVAVASVAPVAANVDVTAPSKPISNASSDAQAVPGPVEAENGKAVSVAASKAVAPPSVVAVASRAVKPTAGQEREWLTPRASIRAGAEEGTGAAPRDEPALLPAAGPNEVPDRPTMGAILSAYSKKQAEAKRCLPPNTTGTHVTLTFSSAGKVTHVAVQPSDLDATSQACIKAALRSVQVAPFARKQFDVTLAL